MNAQLKSKLIFLSILLLCAYVLLNMGLFLSHVLYGLQYSLGILSNFIKAAFGNSQIHLLLHFGFYTLIICSFYRVCNRLVKQFTLTLKWNRYFKNKENNLLTNYINEKYRHHKSELHVIEHDGFIALTIGLFKPKIVLSSFVLTQFDDQEIEAIILHELCHFKNYDPLKVFLVTIILDAINYIPIMKVLVHNYKICKELMADQFVISNMNSSYGLSKALLKVNRIKNNISVSNSLGFVNSAINLRIQQILEPDNFVEFPLNYIKPLVKSCIILSLMSLVFIQ
jgi:beta-lactamase regulating signal transducer with metallopeptidase domain